MEFNFNITDILNEPIVEINRDLIPPGFRGDRRTLWSTVNKVSEVVNTLGEASAAAQGLPKPVTTSERLKNSEHKLYLLVDQNANCGKGTVLGMLKIGAKGLYIFDEEGRHHQVSPPCILDFYIHESSQRKGLGKQLFQHMLHKEQVDPGKMAIDRPSEKLIRFLSKHYGLNSPVKQMNNYVVFQQCFPKKETQRVSPETPCKRLGLGKKESANGLQSQSPAFGRYVASRPPTSVGKLLHNEPEDRTKTIASMPILNQNSPVTNVRESQSNPYYSQQFTNQNQSQQVSSSAKQQGYSNQTVTEDIPHYHNTGTHSNPTNIRTDNQEVLQGHSVSHNQHVAIHDQQYQNQNSVQNQLPVKLDNSLPEFQTQNQTLYHQQHYPSNLQGIQSLHQIRPGERVNAGHQSNTYNGPPQTPMNSVYPQISQSCNLSGQQYIQNPAQQLQSNIGEQPQMRNIQSQHQGMNPDLSMYQQVQPNHTDRPGDYNAQYQTPKVLEQYPQGITNNNQMGISPQNLQNSAFQNNQAEYNTQKYIPQEKLQYSSENLPQQIQMMPRNASQYHQTEANNNNSINTGHVDNQHLNQMVSQLALRQSPEYPTNNYEDSRKQQVDNISEGQNPNIPSFNIQNTGSNQIMGQGVQRTQSQAGDAIVHQVPANHLDLIQNSQNNAQFPQTEHNPTTLVSQDRMRPQEVPETTIVSHDRVGAAPKEVVEKTSAAATMSPQIMGNPMSQESNVAHINPLDSRNMSNPNYISQVQYNPVQKAPVAPRTTVPMKEGVLEYGYPPQLSREQASHFQKPNVLTIIK